MKPDVVTVAVTRVDGGLTVMRVVTRDYRAGWTHEPTPEHINAVIAKYNWQGGQAAVSWRLVPNDFVPETMTRADREFRDAWKDDGGNRPAHDLPKARAIHMARLRKQRAPLLEQLDNEWMRETGRGRKQEADAVEVKREKLRNFTSVQAAADAAQTVEELRNITLPVV